MKTAIALLSILCLCACDSGGSGTPESTDKAKVVSDPVTKVPTKEGVKKEVAQGVDDVLKKRGPKWKVDYSGDLKGSVQGGIFTVMSVSTSTTAVGAAMTKDRKGKAKEAIRVTVFAATTDKPSANVNLTLADGTKCTEDIQKRKLSSIKIIDKDSKTFHAELSGDLKCGAKKDKAISYTATLHKKPGKI